MITCMKLEHVKTKFNLYMPIAVVQVLYLRVDFEFLQLLKIFDILAYTLLFCTCMLKCL